ncbi:hypothetical protein M8312_13575 [Sphingomonas sp. KRR8]|uniref:hypothetical protein n=1 Tax=Sphingomonas sp. KRR8 TaxID=2942996 RepID=UPI0020200284|nr:hypothetical protein [Sphingomonas sp. KRR8]URD60788.1 hypothetical protein M8312_13575 [Sphingomonas sp. KRR8]
MLVYGDHAERVDPCRRLAELAASTGRWASHDQLTDLFVDAAGLAQGIGDADFAAVGEDRPRPQERALLAWLTRFGGTLLTSWERRQTGGEAEPLLDLPDLPSEVMINLAEGYAFYALRPEAIALAARQLRLVGAPRIIGLRSIGTGLACMAAAALGAEPPITLRPAGAPFDRRPRMSGELAAELLAGDPHFVIVDEGPGLSGSSFGGVADWLEDHGAPADRIAFLPSHSGELGPQAQGRHRRRWSHAQRPVASLDEPRRDWIEQLVGPLTGCTDISGGQWRTLWSANEADWPPIDPTWERRKFLARTGDDAWLVKWAGLGRHGAAKLALAKELSAFLPETAGMTHGWLVTRWRDDAVPTRPTLPELTSYLRARAALPTPQPGASLETLVAMVRRNALPGWLPDLSRLTLRPVITDNRMAAHEWLRRPDGRLLKADALDHHSGHDLIGCQDIAWDVAAAVIELDLASSATEQLRTALEVSVPLLAFYQVAYRAFRIGAHRMSAAALAHSPAERRRHEAAAARHAAALAAVDSIEHASHVA